MMVYITYMLTEKLSNFIRIMIYGKMKEGVPWTIYNTSYVNIIDGL